jgi:DNA-binding response OmpR family regulator
MTEPKKILVVEDEADEVSYLKVLFEDNGFAVITAVNGQDGFEKARSQRPDLITLDISMPEESGVRMFRDLQEDPVTAAIPVIIITGITHDFKRFIETRRQVHPPAGYFDKPPDRQQLLAKVRELLGMAAGAA